MGISPSGKFIASCNDKTELIIWNLKGDILDKIDTVHNLTYCCQVSPCGKFVATSGFTSDVKVSYPYPCSDVENNIYSCNRSGRLSSVVVETLRK